MSEILSLGYECYSDVRALLIGLRPGERGELVEYHGRPVRRVDMDATEAVNRCLRDFSGNGFRVCSVPEDAPPEYFGSGGQTLYVASDAVDGTSN